MLSSKCLYTCIYVLTPGLPPEGFFFFFMWSTGPQNVEFCKIIQSIWELCDPETMNSTSISKNTWHMYCVTIFNLKTMASYGGRHNVAGRKIYVSWQAKSHLWRRDSVKQEPWLTHRPMWCNQANIDLHEICSYITSILEVRSSLEDSWCQSRYRINEVLTLLKHFTTLFHNNILRYFTHWSDAYCGHDS